jgi:predicted phage terminase large subunit-like protein
MSSRLNDMRTGAMIVIQQRLGEDDLTGHILSKTHGDWQHLVLPMEYEPERSFSTLIGWRDPRTEPGELLWPERFGPDEVRLLKADMGPFKSAGQLQQRPEPAGGGVIKREWWQPWEAKDFPPMDFILASLDTAYTEKTMNDASALTIWGVFSTDAKAVAARVLDKAGRPSYIDRAYDEGAPKVMLMHAINVRLELHDLVEAVARECRKYHVDMLLVESKASGLSVAQELRRLHGHEDWGVQLNNPGNLDKLSRLYSVQHLFSEGMIYAPSGADGTELPWVEMVIAQVGTYPKGKHDDIVDTVSQALRKLRDMGLIVRAPERIAEIEDMKAYTGRAADPLYPV